MTDAQKAARAARVKALIDCPKTPFAASDEAYLTAQTDARLAELESHAATPVGEEPIAPVAEPVPAVVAPVAPVPSTSQAAPAAAKALSTEELVAALPPVLRGMLDRAIATETARKAELVAALKGAQAEYTEAELTAMDLSALERVSRLVVPVQPATDYAAIGTPRVAGAAPKQAPAPIDMVARIAARAAEKKSA